MRNAASRPLFPPKSMSPGRADDANAISVFSVEETARVKVALRNASAPFIGVTHAVGLAKNENSPQRRQRRYHTHSRIGFRGQTRRPHADVVCGYVSGKRYKTVGNRLLPQNQNVCETGKTITAPGRARFSISRVCQNNTTDECSAKNRRTW